MEKIQQALDRAREQRGSAKAKTPVTQGDAVDVQSIKYTKTKTSKYSTIWDKNHNNPIHVAQDIKIQSKHIHSGEQ